MLLAFDVGNTNIVLGVFKGKKLIQSWRMETDKNKSADEYGMLIQSLFDYHGLDMTEVQDAIISLWFLLFLYSAASVDQVLQYQSHRSRPGN